MRSIKALGLLNQDDCAATAGGITFAALLAADLGCDAKGVKAATAAKLAIGEDDVIIGRLEWLGLFSDKDATAPTKLDAVCRLFQENPKFYYAEGERDMIAMHHTFKILNADGSKETRTSSLVDYGIKGGDTSMARTVTLPLAIAIRKILAGEIKNTGVCRPTSADLYVPILKEMEDSFGIKFTEKTTAGW
jgi:saccharopine dehydrogenase (NADP+, L-glutamate forming)